jgi:hypothetical protein
MQFDAKVSQASHSIEQSYDLIIWIYYLSISSDLNQSTFFV